MKKLIIIPLLLISLLLKSATYYVKTGGNDANTGLSDAQAWAYCPGMVGWTGSVTLSAGDIIRFNRGDTWTSADPGAAFLTISASGTTENYIEYRAYGIGARPILNISANKNFPVISVTDKWFLKFDSLEITHHSATYNAANRSGIYMTKSGAVPPHDIIIQNCVIHLCPHVGIYIISDGYNITIGNTNATVRATPTNWSNHIYDCGYAGVRLYGCDPVSGVSNYNVYYNYVHDIDMGGVLADDAYGIYMGCSSLSTGWPNQCNIRFNYVTNVPFGKGYDCHGGHYMYFVNNYAYNCQWGIDAQACDRVGLPAGVGEYYYIQDNEIEQPGNHPTPDASYGFIRVPAENALIVNHVNIARNTMFYTARPANELTGVGIYVIKVNDVVIENNYIYNGPHGQCVGGIVMGWAVAESIANITVRKNFIMEWQYSIRIGSGTVLGDIKIENNLVNSHITPISFTEVLTLTKTITIYNNCFLSISTAPATPCIFKFDAITIAAGGVVNFKNNILGYWNAAVVARYIMAPIAAIAGTLTMDYNIFWNSSFATPWRVAGVDRNLATWQGLGYEINTPNLGISLNPLLRGFNMYTRATDFDLKAASPAINTGTDVGLTYDKFGFEIIGLPDIGAIEYRSYRFYVK